MRHRTFVGREEALFEPVDIDTVDPQKPAFKTRFFGLWREHKDFLAFGGPVGLREWDPIDRDAVHRKPTSVMRPMLRWEMASLAS